jgi:AcrR family transcriptional regulator
MTIEAVAKRAQVSVPTVYAVFKSKTGILTAFLDQSMFGSVYEDIVRYAQSATDPETRLRRAASVAKQIRSVQSTAFELMRGRV